MILGIATTGLVLLSTILGARTERCVPDTEPLKSVVAGSSPMSGGSEEDFKLERQGQRCLLSYRLSPWMRKGDAENHSTLPISFTTKGERFPHGLIIPWPSAELGMRREMSP